MNSFLDLRDFLEYNHSSLLEISTVSLNEETTESEAVDSDIELESPTQFTELFPEMLMASYQLLAKE